MSSGQVSGVLSVSEEESRVDPIQVARRCSKVFQRCSASLVPSYELEMFKVCRDDMPCGVKKSKKQPLGFFGGAEISTFFYMFYTYNFSSILYVLRNKNTCSSVHSLR